MTSRRLKGGVLIVLALLVPSSISIAQTAEELQHKIAEQNDQIKALDDEIAKYEKELVSVGTKKQSLENTIAELNLSIKKLDAEIKKTKSQISATQLEIQKLSKSIVGKEDMLRTSASALMESLRQLNQVQDIPFAVAILSSGQISDAWEEMDVARIMQVAVRENIDKVSKEKIDLEETKKETEAQKAKLVKQQSSLVSQQGSLSAVKATQNDLLKQTKAQESTYQDILTDKKAAKAAFEAALTDLKDKLRYTVDPSQIPAGGKGILRWPIDNVRVTQQFGNTEFARSGAYNGKGHNGIDLAARIGTPIKAALTGVVVGTGNTDSVRGCYSFGKWVMVTHSNGLSTMYAHLSTILVTTGEQVGTGETIGYSGVTGYATGPHLHFGVYLTSATQIVKLGDATVSKSPCASVVMPVAPLSGYLNPMSYL